MKKKLKIIIFSLIILLVPSNMNADINIVTLQEEKIINNQICAFQEYFINFDEKATTKEILLIDNKTNFLIEAFETTADNFEIRLPLNAINIRVETRESINEEVVENSIILNTSDCEYAKSVEDLNLNFPHEFTVLNGNLKISGGEITEIKYGKSGEKLEKLDEIDSKFETQLESDIYHFEITSNNIKKYYEADLNTSKDQLLVREINELETKGFGFEMKYKWLIITCVLLIMFFIFKINYRKTKRKEKLENKKNGKRGRRSEKKINKK